MWKDVAGYEGCYMVSNFGRVMSLGREVPNSDKSNKTPVIDKTNAPEALVKEL